MSKRRQRYAQHILESIAKIQWIEARRDLSRTKSCTMRPCVICKGYPKRPSTYPRH